MLRWIHILAAAAILACPPACRDRDDAKPADPPPAKPEPSRTPQDQPGAQAPPAVAEALRAIRSKRACNRVMGCEPAETLVRAGVDAVAPIVELLRETSGDAYYRPVLVRVLGRIGHHAAAPFVRELLADDRWLMAASAAVALGRIGDEDAKDQLGRMARGDGDRTEAEQAAAAYALAKRGSAEHRKVLANLLTPDTIENTNWGYTRLAVELATELRLRESLPGIRAAASHDDVFLRKAAVEALGELRDLSAAPILIDRLDDPVPSVRRAAEAGLRAITGKKLSGQKAWQSWCEEKGCRGSEDAGEADEPTER